MKLSRIDPRPLISVLPILRPPTRAQRIASALTSRTAKLAAGAAALTGAAAVAARLRGSATPTTASSRTDWTQSPGEPPQAAGIPPIPPTPDALDVVAREEAAAAAEAGSIGGAGTPVPDPAQRAVQEAGGGVSEGFEQAEADLIANASHDDGRGYPLGDRLTGETESDLSGAAYGEADDPLGER